MIYRTSSALYPNGVMPAERASVPSSSAIPTHQLLDIPPNSADSGGRGGLRLALILVASFMVVVRVVQIALGSF